ncbi:FAD-dependent oxidoreductase [Tsukamurella tyrosinosolvens]|uniref:flavin monoamine oxidase family protein n=1 Tax=Tsukamurella tyrosinosolvens TaxID=57704 RepID=UPI001AF862DC|nr:NAD(P)/FAD-dependent oxidoreductase [Tsukamurella tyrosinosolvens]QRY84810.1 FAD-dependent oxidoreductase [Tsukamurella tyrosinosolvens]
MTNDPEHTAEERTVVVVGAGVAGLRTALGLHDRGVDVLVLEAAPRVGGRVLTETTALGSHVDLGGQWIGAGHHRFTALAAEYGAQVYAMETPRLPRLVDGPRTVGLASPTFLLAGAALAAWEGLVRLGGPHLGHDVLVGDLLRRVPGRARRLLRVLFEIASTADPERLTLRDFAATVRTMEGLTTAMTTRGGAQDSLVVDGAGTLAVRMAERLGDRVRTESPVLAIHRDDTGATVHTATGTVRCRHVVVTVPPPVAAAIEHRPPLPAGRSRAERGMYMGSVYKALAVYERPFWRERGHAEMIAIDDPGVGVFDTSPPSAGGPGHLCLLVGGTDARTLDDLSPADRRDALLGRLAHHLGEGVRAPASWHEKSWHLDEYVGGGYLAFPDPAAGGLPFPLGHAPAGTVHWAGTETAGEHAGYIEGALESGERAAAEVLAALA